MNESSGQLDALLRAIMQHARDLTLFPRTDRAALLDAVIRDATAARALIADRASRLHQLAEQDDCS